MRKKLIVQAANVMENALVLEVSETITGLVPAEQILVDSEHYSFIYLMEDSDDYTYIVLPEPIWPDMKMAAELPVWISDGNEKIELQRFNEEFDFIINNIKGNSNYGKEMVEKAETVFHP
ncbi:MULTISPECIES: hypothetical protein [Neobacillus]|uniref:Uncharacterized protein n=1 Tax=Neobacillus citreus TaxID=2833578 RepID=A0A942SWL7_9BACI|nr:hypothetical protein [Neobacillus citreus]MCH6265179.1 hypothetical protein [Neobacillus citreus]